MMKRITSREAAVGALAKGESLKVTLLLDLNLDDVLFSGTDLSDAGFCGSSLARSRFDSALLLETDLSEVQAERVAFRKSRFVGANLTFSTLSSAQFLIVSSNLLVSAARLCLGPVSRE